MAFSAGKNAVIKVDSGAGSLVDLSAYLNKGGVGLKVDMLDTTTFGAAAKTRIPGLKDGDKIPLAGPFDGALYAHFATIWGNGGGLTSGNGSLSFEYYPAGTTSTYPKMTGECFLSGLNVDSDVGNPNAVTVELTVTGDVTTTTA